MKLELKHLAPYLPYGLKVIVYPNKRKTLTGNDKHLSEIGIDTAIDYQAKPILKPIFSIPQSIVDASPYNNHDDLIENLENGECPYYVFVELFSKKIDVFGLIDAGLAIDVNTITP